MDILCPECWVHPMAAGYLPHQYQEHLAGTVPGGRLIALSKYPKPDVRRICISDAIRLPVDPCLRTPTPRTGACYLLLSKLQPGCYPILRQYCKTGRHTFTTFCRAVSAVNAHVEKIQPCSEASFASDSNDPLIILPMDAMDS